MSSTRDSDGDRAVAVGLVMHERGAGELARSQTRVRLAVAAWMRGLRLVETFELDDSGGDEGPLLGRLLETAAGVGARLVLTAGAVDSAALEAALVWSGLQALPVRPPAAPAAGGGRPGPAAVTRAEPVTSGSPKFR